MSDRAFLGGLTQQLKALRLPDEDAVILTLAIEANEDCLPESDSAIRATVRIGGVTGTSAAIHLQDALLMARANVHRAVAAEQKRREEEKAKAKEPQS